MQKSATVVFCAVTPMVYVPPAIGAMPNGHAFSAGDTIAAALLDAVAMLEVEELEAFGGGVGAGLSTQRETSPVVFSILPAGQSHFAVFAFGFPSAPHAKFSAAGDRRSNAISARTA